MLDRSTDAVPRRAEDRGHLAPAQSLGPAREEPAVGRRQVILPVAPGHHLDDDSTPFAVHPAHPVRQEDHEPPQGHELEVPYLEAVIRGAATTTTGAMRPAVLPGPHLDHQGRAIIPLLQAGRA